jgi:hypothetical protein
VRAASRRASAFGATSTSTAGEVGLPGDSDCVPFTRFDDATRRRGRAWSAREDAKRGMGTHAASSRGTSGTAARAAMLALTSLGAIAALATKLDAAWAAGFGLRSGALAASEAVIQQATARAEAEAEAPPSSGAYTEDEAVEKELVIGDESVAYVAKGWNAERRLIGEEKIEAIWEGPGKEDDDGELHAAQPEGALLVLHGCHHSAKDYFANNAKCTECKGLPQEMMITRTALNHGYVVIAISSFGTCWSAEIDGPRVGEVLKAFYNETALSNLPLYAFGASSGGSFVGMLPTILPRRTLSGLIVQISPVALTKEELQAYPPTVFSHMPRDERTAEFIAKNIEQFKKAGVTTIESRLKPRAIDADYFYHESFGKISKEESAAMLNTLSTFNLVNDDGYLTDDPRSFDDDHVNALRLHAPEWDSLLPDQSDVRELLNVAYATHELSSEDFTRNFGWLIRTHRQRVRNGDASS